MSAFSERFHAALVSSEDTEVEDLAPEVAAAVPRNATRLVVAHTLQNVGDHVVDAKTVLTWIVAATGAPAAIVGMLVPIRDAGSMVPQVFLAPAVRRLAVRRWVWVAGAAVQALAVAAMALVTAILQGLAAGVGLLLSLGVFATARAAASFASKDVLGRTLPRGQRGQIGGLSTVGAGIAAITVGTGMRVVGGEQTPASTYAWLLLAAAAVWVAAAAVYARIEEVPGERDEGRGPSPIEHAIGLLRHDRPFRRFVLARSLLLVSALSPPFVVALATERGGTGLEGLGVFVVAGGVAALVAGRFWGRASDRSSKATMQWAAGLSSAIVVGFVLALQVGVLADQPLVYAGVHLLLAIAHTGSRLGRKTYVVDLAEGNRRTDYVAVSNTAMGVILLGTGGVSAAIATLGAEAALLFLAALGGLGVRVAASLPEVSAGARPG